jgi:hypothetical protein
VDKEKNKGGRPLKFKTVKELQKKIDAYFKKCDKGEKREVYDARKQQLKTIIVKIPYTITGLALALDCDRHTIQDYGERDGFSTTVKRAKLMVENSYELSLRSKGGAGEIFGLKNFGWKDKTETELSTKDDKPINVGINWIPSGGGDE